MDLYDDLLASLPEGTVTRAVVGLHWTAVAVDAGGEHRCGLASTLSDPIRAHREADVPDAGRLEGLPAREMASWIRSSSPAQASLGMAAINALLPPRSGAWTETNAEAVIAERGRGKHVALVGDFPFVPHLREQVGTLSVLERVPERGDHPESDAPEILSRADVVALTAMTLVNGSFPRLLSYCRRDAFVVVLGPSTPLTPALFRYGVDSLCGSVVTDEASVLQTVEQGGNFRQVHRAGVRLVCMDRGAEGNDEPGSGARRETNRTRTMETARTRSDEV